MPWINKEIYNTIPRHKILATLSTRKLKRITKKLGITYKHLGCMVTKHNMIIDILREENKIKAWLQEK